MTKIEQKLQRLGLTLPELRKPLADYVPGVQIGNLVFLSGAIPRRPDGSMMTGKLGQDLTTEQGYEAARLCALDMLANLKATIGDLDKIKRVVKVLGMVNSTPEFGAPGKVISGFSDLLVQLLGEQGRHARCSVGVALGNNLAVEIETVIEVAEG